MDSMATTATSTNQQSLYMDDKCKKEGSKTTQSSNSKSNLRSGNSSNRRCAFTRKCARLVKEHRARFYIMRRCVTMLICWREYSDS